MDPQMLGKNQEQVESTEFWVLPWGIEQQQQQQATACQHDDTSCYGRTCPKAQQPQQPSDLKVDVWNLACLV